METIDFSTTVESPFTRTSRPFVIDTIRFCTQDNRKFRITVHFELHSKYQSFARLHMWGGPNGWAELCSVVCTQVQDPINANEEILSPTEHRLLEIAYNILE